MTKRLLGARRWLRVLLIAGVCGTSGAIAQSAAAATIAYPDLQVQVPTDEISIGHPTPGTKSLQFSHVTWNAGAGPLEIRPSYNSATGISQGLQALYASSGGGHWTFDHTVPIVGPMIWDPPSDYRFPLSKFWLYSVGADGGIGSLVATSPKVDFCMTADTFVGGVPNTPSSTAYPGGDCNSPGGTLGLDVGWGDKYDATDGGENIDITGLPDGTYWLRAEADPDHYLAESDVSNNITDTKVTISGDQVQALGEQLNPNSTPPSLALSSPAAGTSVSGRVTLTATATGPAPISQVQFLLDGQPLGSPVTAAPYSMTWNVGSVPPGSHYLSVQATDSRGFVGTAAAVPINVASPPIQIGSIAVDSQASATGNGDARRPPSRRVRRVKRCSPLSAPTARHGPDRDGHRRGPDTETGQASQCGRRRRRGLDRHCQRPAVECHGYRDCIGPRVRPIAEHRGPYGCLRRRCVGHRGRGKRSAHDSADEHQGRLRHVRDRQRLQQRRGAHRGSRPVTSGAIAGRKYGGQLLDSVRFLSKHFGWSEHQAQRHGSHRGRVQSRRGRGYCGVASASSASRHAATARLDHQSAAWANRVRHHSSKRECKRQCRHQVSAVLPQGNPLGAPVTSPPYAVSWNTTTATNGSNTPTATAVDPSGNVGRSSSDIVTVQNPLNPPRCFVMDAHVSVDGSGAVTTPAFHTPRRPVKRCWPSPPTMGPPGPAANL